MAFPSPHMGGFGGGHQQGMGHMGGMQMLPAPPGMMPPSPMGMHGQAGQMQLARRGTMPAFGQQPPSHDPMMFGPPALSAGHPSPMSPMDMQQLQAARMRGASHGQPPMIGAGPGAYGQPDFGGLQHLAQQPQTPMTPHMGGGYPSHLQAQQAQAFHQMQSQQQPQHYPGGPGQEAAFPSPHHALAQHPGGMHCMPTPPHSGNSGASAIDPSLPVIVPLMDDQTAAYVMGGAPAMNLSGRLQGQGADSASTQQSGNGEFDMEQEVTVKTKLKGRGTFSGNMNGTMQDSMNAALKMDAGGASAGASGYPSNLPPPYDPRMLAQHQQEMYGGQGGMQSGMHGMSGFPGTPQMSMGRPSTPF